MGIDCRMLGPQCAGLGRYVEQLVKNLQKIDLANQYILFLHRSNWEQVEATNNFIKVEANIPWYSWQEQIKFKKIIEREQVDLMHFPHWNVPLFYNQPFVVTIHDLIMYHYPRQEASTHGLVVYWFKDLLHRFVLRHAVKKAKQIIVTSEFTKQDVHQTLGVALEKMVVIYQSPFQIANCKLQISNQIQNSNDQILKRFGINKKYVLYVGNAYPHKNLEGLLKAWKVFIEKYGDDYQLVLVGKENYFYQKLLNNPTLPSPELVPSFISGRGGNVVFTDFVSDEELVGLYKQAKLYVFPSLYEGFGLPPLEAMTYGVPVASSNSSCLPEILGEAAIYFDPENFEQMAEVIQTGLTNEDVRYDLSIKAPEELKRYSGEKLARETLVVYRR